MAQEIEARKPDHPRPIRERCDICERYIDTDKLGVGTWTQWTEGLATLVAHTTCYENRIKAKDNPPALPPGIGDTSRAIVPADTMQPDAAEQFVSANVGKLPNVFTMFVSYGRLFAGTHRPAAEGQIMEALMLLLAHNFSVKIVKDDPAMRLAMHCKREFHAGEILDRSIGAIIG